MTDVNRVTELDLLAYADGLLDDDPGRKATVEAALEADPAARERAEAFRAQTRALRAAYDWRLDEPVPERLSAALERPAPRLAPALRAAAVALLTVGAGAGGWFLGQDVGQGEGDAGWSAARLVERSYAQFVAERPNELAPALASNVGAAQPLGWLADEVSIRLKAPDLSDAGYRLMDKQAVSVDGEQIVRLDYGGTDGHGFSLFLAPRWEAKPDGIAQAERGGVSMAYWLDGPLASTLVARMPAQDTKALAEAVRQAMHAGGSTPAVLDPAPADGSPQGAGTVAGTLAPRAEETSPQLLHTLDQGAPLQRN